MFYDFELSEDYALVCDANDELQHFRDLFLIPKDDKGKEIIYFCGNSLGLQPKTTAEILQNELEAWSKYGVRAFDKAKPPWMIFSADAEERLGRLIGASSNEVAIGNTLSVNLHLMMTSFYRPEGKRNKILIEQSAFPSDLYALKSQMKLHGIDPTESLICLEPLSGDSTISYESFEEVFETYGNSIALVLLGGVNYYTGQAFPMDKISKLAHSYGATIGLDLAHAIANIELNLHDWEIDFAVWCSYKYLNAGPGAVAGYFVHENHHGSTFDRLAGWWGFDAASRFDMLPDFVPAQGADGWQLSNPSVLLVAILKSSLSIIEQAGFDKMKAKSKKLTAYLEFLINNLNHDNFEIITPSESAQRGAQISIRVVDKDKSIFDRLTQNGITADWRTPDVIRVAPTPLYNSFHEVFRFVQTLEKIITYKGNEM